MNNSSPFTKSLVKLIKKRVFQFIGSLSIFIFIVVALLTVRDQKQLLHILENQLYKNTVRVLSYGEPLQLQPLYSDLLLKDSSRIEVYISLKAQEKDSQIVFSGNERAIFNFIKLSSSKTFTAPIYGDLVLNVTFGLDHLFYIILFWIIFSSSLILLICVIFISKIETQIASKCVEIDELEALLTLENLDLRESGLKRALEAVKSYTNSQIELNVMRRISSIARQVAHDIKSPIAAILAVSRTSKSIDESERSILEIATDRIDRISKDFLLIDLNERKAIEFGQKSHFEISNKVSLFLLFEEIQKIVKEKSIQIRNSLNTEIIYQNQISNVGDDSNNLFVYLKIHTLMRVLSNLINNSLEARDKSTLKIIIEVQILNKNLNISITDNGKGIPQSEISKIGFDSYSYGKNSAQGKSGFGLGLSHAFKTIKEFDGTIYLSSDVGVGTRVSISLPIVE